MKELRNRHPESPARKLVLVNSWRRKTRSPAPSSAKVIAGWIDAAWTITPLVVVG